MNLFIRDPCSTIFSWWIMATNIPQKTKQINYSEDYFLGQHQRKSDEASLLLQRGPTSHSPPFNYLFLQKSCTILNWRHSQARLNSLSFNPEQKWIWLKMSKQTTTENNVCLSLLTQRLVSKKVSDDLEYSKQSWLVRIHLDKFLIFPN